MGVEGPRGGRLRRPRGLVNPDVPLDPGDIPPERVVARLQLLGYGNHGGWQDLQTFIPLEVQTKPG